MISKSRRKDSEIEKILNLLFDELRTSAKTTTFSLAAFSKVSDDFKKRAIERVFNNKNKAQETALHLACQGNYMH